MARPGMYYKIVKVRFQTVCSFRSTHIFLSDTVVFECMSINRVGYVCVHVLLFLLALKVYEEKKCF